MVDEKPKTPFLLCGFEMIRHFKSTLRIALATAGLIFLARSASATMLLEGPITNPANAHQYYLLESATWTESENAALTLLGADAHLVTINDQDEQNWVYDTFRFLGYGQYFWIGLNDVAEEGTFVWTSGEPFSYDNWKPGEPNSGGGVFDEDYVHFEPDGLWNDNVNDAFGTPVFGIVETGNPVPEPSFLALIGIGAISLLGYGWKRRRRG
jgi:hypothetical protein